MILDRTTAPYTVDVTATVLEALRRSDRCRRALFVTTDKVYRSADGVPWVHLDIAGPAFNEGKPFGYMDPGDWIGFTGFMADQGQIRERIPTGELLTNTLLPGEIPETSGQTAAGQKKES